MQSDRTTCENQCLDFTERGHQIPKYSHIEIALEENMPFTTWVGRGYFDEEDTLVCLVS
jgi:hypothetical protein